MVFGTNWYLILDTNSGIACLGTPATKGSCTFNEILTLVCYLRLQQYAQTSVNPVQLDHERWLQEDALTDLQRQFR